MKKGDLIILTVALSVAIFIGSLFIIDLGTTRYKDSIEHNKNAEYEKISKPSYEYLKSITVYITGSAVPEETDDGTAQIINEWAGTGIVIKITDDYTYILTNAHVAGRNEKNVKLYVENEFENKEAEIVAYYPTETYDLAVIRVKGRLKNKRIINGFSTALPSDKIYLVGHHLGRKYVYGEGVFAGYQGDYGLVQIPVLYGNSGSGVCDVHGNVVGIIFGINIFGFGQVDNTHGLIIESYIIKNFLKRLNLYE